MKCKDCEHYSIKWWTSGFRKSFDGYKCALTGNSISNESEDRHDCPLGNNGKVEKKSIDPDAEFVEID